ncbi:MAG TPA: uroporphyrinogen-III C-methyltransferase [Bacillota bacterium]|nr:uroporphyrinogen-III C-methyltransferase [Bacillota bacterium]
MTKGIVYLVGAGPGDPKLITVKGLECIQKADVLVYDRLANPKLLQYARPDAELIYCGKLPNNHTLRQEVINELLAVKALEGKIVTRLKGGDPFVFGRGGEEAEVLVQHGVAFEIVPGVTSGIAAPAYAGIPVTHREYASSFAIVTGHTDDLEESEARWQALATGIDTIAFYMGMSKLPFICDQLIRYGRDPETPVAIIAWGTTAKQQVAVGTLGNIVKHPDLEKLIHPAIILVGEVVRLRERLDWLTPEALLEMM